MSDVHNVPMPQTETERWYGIRWPDSPPSNALELYEALLETDPEVAIHSEGVGGGYFRPDACDLCRRDWEFLRRAGEEASDPEALGGFGATIGERRVSK